MKRYAALLRGINVAGHRRVAMADLRAAFIDLGFEDVTTYVQSGNVIFTASRPADRMVPTIEKRLGKLADAISVILRSADQLQAIVRANPFARRGTPTTLHVTFLAGVPDADRVKALRAREFLPDELAVKGSEVYLHCPRGYGRSKLTNSFFEKQLAVIATTRNWNTTTTLARLASEQATR